MDKFFYDLHIHSILSPCADELMTPNNILNMAMLNGLDFVSVTDHNSTKQLPVFYQLIESYDMILIPGIEVTTAEGFDVLFYFKDLETAMIFDAYIERHLGSTWGSFTQDDQVLTDIYDLTVDTYPNPLQSTTLMYHELAKKVRSLHGAIILAHVDRASSSAMSHYELSELDFDAIGIQKHNYTHFIQMHPELNKYKQIISSDAHTLLQISEQEHAFHLEEKTIDAFFRFIRSDKHE